MKHMIFLFSEIVLAEDFAATVKGSRMVSSFSSLIREGIAGLLWIGYNECRAVVTPKKESTISVAWRLDKNFSMLEDN